MTPTYYVQHPDGSYSVADPQPSAQAATCKQDLQVDALLDEMLDTLPYNSPDYWIGRIMEVRYGTPTPPAQQEWIDDAGRLQWALWRIKDLEQQLAGRPVAVTPPAQRVMLTDDEIVQLSLEWPAETNDWASHIDFARAVIEAYEQKNGIK